MSKSLRLFNGDLVVGERRSYQTVSGSSKLLQDLRLHILEHLGTDPMNPEYGSVLDGGFVDGRPVPSYIGKVATPSLAIDIRDEVVRVIQKYQIDQVEKVRREIFQYQATTLTADEVIKTINKVESILAGDTVIVKVKLTTASGNELTLLQPIGA